VFDPIRSYDKPGVIISQVANGIASTDSVRRVLFDPAALSPNERESFSDRLKAQYGGNAVADTAIDVLTNPIIWLGIACAAGSAPGIANLQKGGNFFGGYHGAGDYAGKKFPWLRKIGLTSGMTESMHERKVAIARNMMHNMDQVREHMGSIMNEPTARLLDRVSEVVGTRVTTLNPDAVSDPNAKRALEEIRAALGVQRLGWHEDHTETRVLGVSADRYHIRAIRDNPDPTGKSKSRSMEISKDLYKRLAHEMGTDRTVLTLNVEEHKPLLRRMPGLSEGENMLQSLERLGLKDTRIKLGRRASDVKPEMNPMEPGLDRASQLEGGVRVDFEKKLKGRKIKDLEALETINQRYGLHEFQDAERQLYEYGRVLLAGDEAHYAETGEFKIDQEKLLRLARNQIRTLQDGKYVTEGGTIQVGGEEAVRRLLSDEFSGQLMKAAEQRGRLKRGIKVGSTAEEIKQVLVDAYKTAFEDPYYMPRNTTEAYDATGNRIQYNPYKAEIDNVAGGGVVGGEGGSSLVSGRGMMRTRTSRIKWDPRDLERIDELFGGTDELHRLIRHARTAIRGQSMRQNMYRTMRIAPDIAASKYIASVSRDYAAFARDVSADPEMRVIMKDFGPSRWSGVQLPGPLGNIQGGGEQAGIRSFHEIEPSKAALGGLSAYDLLDADLRASAHATDDAYAINLWREHIIPSMFGIKSHEAAAHAAAASEMREGVRRFADSRLMRAVERSGGKYAARFVQDMRNWASDPMGDAAQPWQNATRVLYASHIGLNMGTVLLNLMHPLQSVHHLGFRETVRAYGQSFDMIGKYMTERAKLGVNAKPEDVKALMSRAFSRKFGDHTVDLTQIADIAHTWERIDKAGYGVSTNVGKPQFSFLEMMMKPFQVSETLNRVMTANSVYNAYEHAGRVHGDDLIRAGREAGTAVEFFRFGTDPINRPALFYTGIGKNPAFRQFAQYGLRSFANLFTATPMMGGPRHIGPMEVTGKVGTRFADIMKLLAVSATVYEIGKDTLGVDMSRGLAFGPVDLVGGSDALQQKNFPMYVPPVLSAGWNAARYLATGDQDILKDLAPTLLPGGVAISRVLGVSPQNDAISSLGLQKTYADWSKSDNGMVPVFNADGRFMGEYPTSDLILRAFGTDMGRFNNPHELGQFLMKNREQIREARRQFIAATLGNNMSQATSIKAQFEKRFGMPLTVTQAQFKEAIKLREESVIGRTVETMDKDVRGQYQQAVQQYLPGQLARAPMQPVQQGAMYQWGQG